MHNVDILRHFGMVSLQAIHRLHRLCWLGHVVHMDGHSLPTPSRPSMVNLPMPSAKEGILDCTSQMFVNVI